MRCLDSHSPSLDILGVRTVISSGTGEPGENPMQGYLNFFNFLIESIFLTGTAYVSVGFVLGLIRLWHESHPEVVAMKAQQKHQAALPAATAPALADAVKMQDLRELEPVALEDDRN
ncbi:MAG: hypothetical protein VKL39_22165 [Leptolyngbyaceae bacterium]|nr:hypothetical protein [Leptolyngbyaceae bacterium]